MRRVPDLVRRQRALEKTVRKYRGRPHDWVKHDCIRMLRSHLVAMGHRGLPPIPAYGSAAEARRALAAAGHDGIAALLDSLLLPRIARAAALPGDILLLKGDEGFDSVTISLGFKTFGWHQDAPGAAVLTPHAVEGAWRA